MNAKQKIIHAALNDIIKRSNQLAADQTIAITFVKNSAFPKGVYRFHKMIMIPTYLTISDEEIKEVVDSMNGKVSFDILSGWLTIKS